MTQPNDLDSYWMPFTGNRNFKANAVVPQEECKGVGVGIEPVVGDHFIQATQRDGIGRALNLIFD